MPTDPIILDTVRRLPDWGIDFLFASKASSVVSLLILSCYGICFKVEGPRVPFLCDWGATEDGFNCNVFSRNADKVIDIENGVGYEKRHVHDPSLQDS